MDNLSNYLMVIDGISESQKLAVFRWDDNETDCSYDGSCVYGLDKRVQISVLCLYVISLVLAVGGNVTILYIILKFLSRSTTKIFICSLCLSDILLFLVCVPVTVVSDLIYMYWPFWSFLCPVVTFLQVATVLQRAFTLLALTLDKHYVAWKPLGRRLTHRSAKITILSIWIVSGIIAAPSWVNSKLVHMEYEPGSKGLCTEVWTNYSARSKYSFSLMLMQYVVPVLVMACSYCHIACIIWAKTPPGESNKDRDRRLAKTKRRAVKMLMVVVIAYAVCWLPLHILTMIGEKNPSIFNYQSVHYMWLLSHWLATSNSAVNPIVYFWMNSSYRAGFKYIFSSSKRGSGRNFTQTFCYMMRTNKLFLYLTYNKSDSQLMAGETSDRAKTVSTKRTRLPSSHVSSEKDEVEIRVFARPNGYVINKECMDSSNTYQSRI